MNIKQFERAAFLALGETFPPHQSTSNHERELEKLEEIIFHTEQIQRTSLKEAVEEAKLNGQIFAFYTYSERVHDPNNQEDFSFVMSVANIVVGRLVHDLEVSGYMVNTTTDHLIFSDNANKQQNNYSTNFFINW
jgi:hypothetical protein